MHPAKALLVMLIAILKYDSSFMLIKHNGSAVERHPVRAVGVIR
jgi:hypothetical protein